MSGRLLRSKYLKENGHRFKLSSVARNYEHRPPYSDEVFQTLLGLPDPSVQSVLDAGCGPGRIAIGLSDHVSRIDAIDFSQGMIDIGKSMSGGDHPSIHWQHSAIEDATLNPPYSLIVTGASIHWINWDVVFRIFKDALSDDGFLAVVEGDSAMDPPWKQEENELDAEFRETSRPEDNPCGTRPWTLLKTFEEYGLVEWARHVTTAPITFAQSIEDYVSAKHSRASKCIDAIGEAERVREFDERLRSTLSVHSVDDQVSFQVTTHIDWGIPLP
jgi:SAM-dependent methyltransferase